jgi:protein ImuB
VQSRLDDKAISLLYNVGMRTLRDVFALPRAELTRRIGPAALAALDRMRGIAHEVLPLYQPPDRFDHRIDLDDRVEAWPPLLFPLRRLCNELALFLTARDGGVQRCELALDHEDHTTTRVAVELLTPQREARMLYELVRSRLERVALTQPVCGIALIARDLPTLRPQHQDLFEPKRAQALDWDELAERLRAHLGDGAVRRLASAADHRPENAWRFDIEVKPITELRPRPLWLLTRAIPLRGPAPRILAGPERLESGWWDGGDARRDYYVVQTREGQRAWAFLAAGASDGWMLHGWFA